MTVHPKFTPAYHEPGRNDPCVCGSKIKFKKCCSGRYSHTASQHFKDAFNSGNYDSALTYARNHFTWYVLCHRAHTIPFLESKEKMAWDWLRMDIEALAAILDNLHLCYFRTGRSDDFLGVIDHASAMIRDKRWDDKISYIRALWNLVDKKDKRASFAALQAINIDSCEDPSILSIYLQVNPQKLSLSTTVSILDRIIQNIETESYRFQYSIMKGLHYYLTCQPEDGGKIIGKAISRYKQLDKKTQDGDRHLAFGLEMYGVFSGRKEYLEEAAEVAQRLFRIAEEENYPPSYKAELLKLIGDCEQGLGKHSEACASYARSIEAEPSELSKVFLARSICNSGDHARAREVAPFVWTDFLDA